MKLAISRQGAVVGAMAGGLAGFLLNTFGISDLTGGVSRSEVLVLSLLIGAAVGLLGGQRILVVVNGFLALVYVIVGYTPFMTRMAPRWVRSDPIPATADAIVVLSAATIADTALNIDGTERLLSGLELLQRGVAHRIVTSEAKTAFGDGVLSTTPDQARLIALAGASPAWTAVGTTESTRQEAVQAAAKLLPSAREIVVVTSPMHTRRACAAFEAVGFKVACYPALTRGHSTWHPMFTGDRIAAFADYIYERLGMVKYRWKHWVPR